MNLLAYDMRNFSSNFGFFPALFQPTRADHFTAKYFRYKSLVGMILQRGHTLSQVRQIISISVYDHDKRASCRGIDSSFFWFSVPLCILFRGFFHRFTFPTFFIAVVIIL